MILLFKNVALRSTTDGFIKPLMIDELIDRILRWTAMNLSLLQRDGISAFLTKTSASFAKFYLGALIVSCYVMVASA
jgi:hypothetical protein